MNTSGKYNSFSRNSANSGIRDRKMDRSMKQKNNQDWYSISNKKDRNSYKRRLKNKNSNYSSTSKLLNGQGVNIIKSNFTLNPENEYNTKRNTNYFKNDNFEKSSFLSNNRDNLSSNVFESKKDINDNLKNSTFSSTTFSKMGRSTRQSEIINRKKGQLNNYSKFESDDFKIDSHKYNKRSDAFNQKRFKRENNYNDKRSLSKTYNPRTMTKDQILKNIQLQSNKPIMLYNIEVNPNENDLSRKTNHNHNNNNNNNNNNKSFKRDKQYSQKKKIK